MSNKIIKDCRFVPKSIAVMETSVENLVPLMDDELNCNVDANEWINGLEKGTASWMETIQTQTGRMQCSFG